MAEQRGEGLLAAEHLCPGWGAPSSIHSDKSQAKAIPVVKDLLRGPQGERAAQPHQTGPSGGPHCCPQRGPFWKRGEGLSCSLPEARTSEWNDLEAEFSHCIAKKKSSHLRSPMVDGSLQNCSNRGCLSDRWPGILQEGPQDEVKKTTLAS